MSRDDIRGKAVALMAGVLATMMTVFTDYISNGLAELIMR